MLRGNPLRAGFQHLAPTARLGLMAEQSWSQPTPAAPDLTGTVHCDAPRKDPPDAFSWSSWTMPRRHVRCKRSTACRCSFGQYRPIGSSFERIRRSPLTSIAQLYRPIGNVSPAVRHASSRPTWHRPTCASGPPRLRPPYLQGCAPQDRPSGKAKCVSATRPADAGRQYRPKRENTMLIHLSTHRCRMPVPQENKLPSIKLIAQGANPVPSWCPLCYPYRVLLGPSPAGTAPRRLCQRSHACLSVLQWSPGPARKNPRRSIAAACGRFHAVILQTLTATTSPSCSTRIRSNQRRGLPHLRSLFKQRRVENGRSCCPWLATTSFHCGLSHGHVLLSPHSQQSCQET